MTRLQKEVWQNPDPTWTVANWENAARDFMARHFEFLVYALPYQTYALLVVQPEGDVTQLAQANLVCRKGFVRVMQDLRAAHLLIMTGCPARAGAVATSILELAYEIAWIGRDEHRAEH